MLAAARNAAVFAQVGDPQATRTVYVMIVVLLVLGVTLLGLVGWLMRRTRPEPELLAPLEEMDTRRWRRQTPADQRRSLDEVRPLGARPLKREADVPDRDAEFDAEPVLRDFDDLEAPVAGPEGSDDVPTTSAAAESDQAADAAEDELQSASHPVDDTPSGIDGLDVESVDVESVDVESVDVESISAEPAAGERVTAEQSATDATAQAH